MRSHGQYALVVVLIGSVACSELPIDWGGISGTYVMNHGRAADTLIVHPRGRYRRIYAMPGESVAIDSGKWSVDSVYDLERSRFHVVAAFASFRPRWRAETEAAAVQRSPSLLSPESWPAIPERTVTGRIQFVVDDDLDWAYVRR
jgi:hypothetical protein